MTGETAPQAWVLPEDRRARLEIAKSYPYTALDGAFLLRDGAVLPIEEADFRGRVAVLGHGSNRAPEQLARKFAAFRGAASAIPVTYVWLHDYDVVYSAHVTTYGSVASTLLAAPGCRVRVALTWLDEMQLLRMHETEGNYAYGRLQNVRIEPESGEEGAAGDITMYLSHHGCLSHDSQPVGLAAVPAHGRPHAALHQEEVLETLRRRLAPRRGLDDFILENIADAVLRQERIECLRADAVAASVPHFSPLTDAADYSSASSSEEED